MPLSGVFRESSDELLENGFHIKFVTMKHNAPPHWHRAMEFLYILNGSATVTMDGVKYQMKASELLAIDSTKVHDVVYAMPQTMGITIHISKNFMRRYIPDIQLMQFEPGLFRMTQEQKTSYARMCQCMKELTILYFHQKPSYQLKSNALVLNMLAELVDYFSIPASEALSVTNYTKLARMEKMYHYVEEHHAEEISLQDGADTLGLNKEYFCRMFKANMGISFISYVNQVRIDHIYQDLIQTDDSIIEIMERHGFYNQKLFYRLFKKRYGCTPMQLRKIAQSSPYL